MNYLKIYVDNTYEIYRISEWLVNAMAKKILKGVQMDVDHLANCSTMKTIVRMGVKEVQKMEGVTPTREERKRVAMQHALLD